MPLDQITLAISQLSYAPFTAVSALFDNDLFFLVIILILVFIEERGGKRNRMLLSLASLFVIGLALKYAIHESRPCTEILSKIECPSDYSFPSNHATVAFALAAAMVKKPRASFYAIFAFFIGFSRIYLGVHTLGDVIGGMALGILGYSVLEFAWTRLPALIKDRFAGLLE